VEEAEALSVKEENPIFKESPLSGQQAEHLRDSALADAFLASEVDGLVLDQQLQEHS